MLVFQPREVSFNGKRAAQEFLGTKAVAFGAQQERIGMTVLCVEPSTSGAANGSRDVSCWRDVAERVKTSG